MFLHWPRIAIALGVLSANLHAQEPLELHMPDAPPLTYLSFQGGYGMVGDVALAAIARAGYLTHLHVTPWTRAQQRVSRGHNQLIIPLSRTPQREALYTWIAPVMTLQRSFFSLEAPVADFAEARHRYRRVAVGRGTDKVEILKRQGFSDEQILSIRLGDNPARLLELGRVDAWFTGAEEGHYLWPNDQNRFFISPPLESSEMYLACSKHCDANLVESLRSAVEALRAEGTLKRIQDAYRQNLSVNSD